MKHSSRPVVVSVASALTLAAVSLSAAPTTYAAEHEHGHDHALNGKASQAITQVRGIAQAHGSEAFRTHEAVSADLDLDFPGKFEIRGHIVFDTAGGRSKITTDQGIVITFDGTKASVSPADAPLPPGMGRFHALTWPYFAAAPFKLGDPGVWLGDDGPQPWDDGRLRPALKLTFGEGVGDASDDWFKVFADQGHHLRGMAYIVSYGKTAAEAAKAPSAIVYGGYTDVDGALLSTDWSFHAWDDEQGLSAEPTGHGALRNVTFVEVDDNTFAHPVDMRVDAKP